MSSTTDTGHDMTDIDRVDAACAAIMKVLEQFGCTFDAEEDMEFEVITLEEYAKRAQDSGYSARMH